MPAKRGPKRKRHSTDDNDSNVTKQKKKIKTSDEDKKEETFDEMLQKSRINTRAGKARTTCATTKKTDDKSEKKLSAKQEKKQTKKYVAKLNDCQTDLKKEQVTEKSPEEKITVGKHQKFVGAHTSISGEALILCILILCYSCVRRNLREKKMNIIHRCIAVKMSEKSITITSVCWKF